jgi:sugar lactone lactonase YvrE
MRIWWLTLFAALAACGNGGKAGTSGKGGAIGTGGIIGSGGATGGTTVPTLAVLAGVPSGVGSVDGMGPAARFSFPYGVAVDRAGNIFVTDTGNDTIRKITPTGVVSTLAGTVGLRGSEDGTGAAAHFKVPRGGAVDGAGNIFVADSGNSSIRRITPLGVVTTVVDNTGAAVSFNIPCGVAVDGAGNVFVADCHNHTIRKISPAGVVTTLAGTAGWLEARTARGPRPASTTHLVWRWTGRATSSSPTPGTTPSGRSRLQAW